MPSWFVPSKVTLHSSPMAVWCLAVWQLRVPGAEVLVRQGQGTVRRQPLRNPNPARPATQLLSSCWLMPQPVAAGPEGAECDASMAKLVKMAAYLGGSAKVIAAGC